MGIANKGKPNVPPAKNLPTPQNPPTAAKKPRAPRALLNKDFPGGFNVSERKATVAMNGIDYPVREYVVTFGPEDSRNCVKATLRDALKAAHAALGKGAARKADPMGTLSIIRVARALSSIIKRRDPSLVNALQAAVDSLNADLHWQMDSGVKVDDIRAAEDKRILAVSQARKNAAAK